MPTSPGPGVETEVEMDNGLSVGGTARGLSKRRAYAHARRACAMFRDGDALLVAGIYSRGDGKYLNGP
jgi:hypothetical protein